MVAGLVIGLILGFAGGVIFKVYIDDQRRTEMASKRQQEEIAEKEALKKIHLPPGYEFAGSSPDKRIAVFAKKTENVHISDLSGDDDGRIIVTVEAGNKGAQFQTKFYLNDTLVDDWRGKAFGEKERIVMRSLESFNRVLINFEDL